VFWEKRGGGEERGEGWWDCIWRWSVKTARHSLSVTSQQWLSALFRSQHVFLYSSQKHAFTQPFFFLLLLYSLYLSATIHTCGPTFFLLFIWVFISWPPFNVHAPTKNKGHFWKAQRNIAFTFIHGPLIAGSICAAVVQNMHVDEKESGPNGPPQIPHHSGLPLLLGLNLILRIQTFIILFSSNGNGGCWRWNLTLHNCENSVLRKKLVCALKSDLKHIAHGNWLKERGEVGYHNNNNNLYIYYMVMK